MGLTIKLDKDDRRGRREVLEAVDEQITRTLTMGRRCTIWCGDVECPEACPNQRPAR